MLCCCGWLRAWVCNTSLLRCLPRTPWNVHPASGPPKFKQCFVRRCLPHSLCNVLPASREQTIFLHPLLGREFGIHQHGQKKSEAQIRTGLIQTCAILASDFWGMFFMGISFSCSCVVCLGFAVGTWNCSFRATWAPLVDPVCFLSWRGGHPSVPTPWP